MRQIDVTFARLAPVFSLLMLAAATTDLQAQHRRHHRRPPQSVLGVQFMWADPQGEFAYFVDDGFGLGAHAVFNLDRQRVVGLRMDGTIIVYGHERFSTPLSRTIPRVWVDVTTDNIIASAFLGPQITAAYGPLRPYLHGGFGFSYFSTYSSVHGDSYYDYHPIASSTHFDDWAPALTGGGGIYLALSRTVMIDMAAQYVHNGVVQYVPEGGVYDEPDGTVWLDVIESEADYWV